MPPTFYQPCPRGNATDLGFLTHTTMEDIDRVQRVGREAQESRKQFILHDDQVRVSRLTSLKLPPPPKVVNLGSCLVSRPHFGGLEDRSGLGQRRIRGAHPIDVLVGNLDSSSVTWRNLLVLHRPRFRGLSRDLHSIRLQGSLPVSTGQRIPDQENLLSHLS